MSDYEKLEMIIDEIPTLIAANITSSDPYFRGWKSKADRFLLRKYGKDSYEYVTFSKTSFSLPVVHGRTSRSDYVAACQEGLETSQVIFKTYLKEIAEDEECVTTTSMTQVYDFKNVFIVHGHDGELKQSVARILEKQGIAPIILSEQTSHGKTIIEKIEANSSVGGAICLFTADDVGKGKNESSDSARARQNVVFETGYFWGKLGRDHMIIIKEEGVEMPSDLSGVVYTSKGNWQIELLKELKSMGYEVDLNKLL